MAATYSLLCLSAIKGRLSGAAGREGAYRMPLFPLFPVIGLVALVGVVWASFMDAEEKAALASSLSPWFSRCRRPGTSFFLRKSAWGHRGPATVETPAE